MKKSFSVLFIAVLLLTGCQYFAQKVAQTNTPIIQNKAASASMNIVADKTAAIDSTSAPISTTPQYSIYLIALNDQGLNGKEVGCGDSVVPLIQNSTKTTATNSELLSEAFQNLLSIKDKNLPQSAYSNFLADSKLKLISAEIKDGKAIVRLSGALSLAGECDDPRVKAQLQETAAQFDDVKSVEIYLNNKTLDQATSLKG